MGQKPHKVALEQENRKRVKRGGASIVIHNRVAMTHCTPCSNLKRNFRNKAVEKRKGKETARLENKHVVKEGGGDFVGGGGAEVHTAKDEKVEKREGRVHKTKPRMGWTSPLRGSGHRERCQHIYHDLPYGILGGAKKGRGVQSFRTP